MSVTVRLGTTDDIEWLYNQSQVHADMFSQTYDLAPSKEHAVKYFTNMINNHIILVAENKTERTGYICGYVTPHVFNDRLKVLTAMLWWVRPKYRRTKSGAMLLHKFLDWGKENVNIINFSIQKKTPIRPENLERRGFRLTELAFSMECV